MSNQNIIYGLVDPRTGEIRYIVNPRTGYVGLGSISIRRAMSKSSDYKSNWLKTLHVKFKVRSYNFRVVDSTQLITKRTNDGFHFGRKEGWRLTNLTDGGDGCQRSEGNSRTKEKN